MAALREERAELIEAEANEAAMRAEAEAKVRAAEEAWLEAEAEAKAKAARKAVGAPAPVPEAVGEAPAHEAAAAVAEAAKTTTEAEAEKMRLKPMSSEDLRSEAAAVVVQAASRGWWVRRGPESDASELQKSKVQLTAKEEGAAESEAEVEAPEKATDVDGAATTFAVAKDAEAEAAAAAKETASGMVASAMASGVASALAAEEQTRKHAEEAATLKAAEQEARAKAEANASAGIARFSSSPAAFGHQETSPAIALEEQTAPPRLNLQRDPMAGTMQDLVSEAMMAGEVSFAEEASPAAEAKAEPLKEEARAAAGWDDEQLFCTYSRMWAVQVMLGTGAMQFVQAPQTSDAFSTVNKGGALLLAPLLLLLALRPTKLLLLLAHIAELVILSAKVPFAWDHEVWEVLFDSIVALAILTSGSRGGDDVIRVSAPLIRLQFHVLCMPSGSTPD